MGIEELNLPAKSEYPKRNQISSPVDSKIFERFQSFTKNYGHGSKKILIEKAILNLLDELERK